MKDGVLLGEITCPSGELVLMDGGYLYLWSGSRSPEETRPPDDPPAVDFEIVGLDADAAARSFDRQAGRTLYDIPQHAAAGFIELFDGHCAEHGHRAQLRAFDRQVAHRQRARKAIAAGDPDFLITGVSVVCVGGLPTARPLPVTALPADDGGWADFRIQISDRPAVSASPLGSIGVDCARFVFADADALSAWRHDDTIDGLADVRASAHETATIGVGGARIMFAMTSVGDGFFPVHLEHDATGAVAAIHITVQDHDEPHT